MELKEDVLEISLEIINQLLQNKEVTKIINSDLYYKYVNDVEVENLTDKIAEKMGFEIYRFDNTLNLCVMLNNKTFGYTNENLKNRLKQLNKNEDIYLMYFIIVTLITCFYRESGSNSPRSYLKLEELIETIDLKFENLVKEDLEQISKEKEYNFIDIKKVWQRLPDARENIVGISKNDKVSFVKLILHFLEDEKLIIYDNNGRNIYITTRFKSIVYFYFEYSKENKTQLLEYIYNLGGKENAAY